MERLPRGKRAIGLELEEELGIVAADGDGADVARLLAGAAQGARLQVVHCRFAVNGLEHIAGASVHAVQVALALRQVDVDGGVVAVVRSGGHLPLDVPLGGTQFGRGVDQYGLARSQPYDRDELVLHLELLASQGLQVSGVHVAGPLLVERVHDGAGGASFALADALVLVHVQVGVGRHRDEAQAVSDDLVEQRADALILLPVLVPDGSEVELHGLDGHLGDLGHEAPPESVCYVRADPRDHELPMAVGQVDDLQVHGCTLYPAAPSSAPLLGAVVRYGGHILDAPDLHTRPGQGADGGLCAGTGRGGSVAAGGAHLDMEALDALLPCDVSDPLGGPHGRIRGRFILGLLDHHAAGGLGDGLGAGDVRQGDDDVIVAGEYVSNSPFSHVHSSCGRSGRSADSVSSPSTCLISFSTLSALGVLPSRATGASARASCFGPALRGCNSLDMGL